MCISDPEELKKCYEERRMGCCWYVAGDPSLPDVLVKLYQDKNNNQVLDDEDELVITQLTDEKGKFDFNKLSADAYIIDIDQSTVEADSHFEGKGILLTTDNLPLFISLGKDEIFDQANFGFTQKPAEECSCSDWQSIGDCYEEQDKVMGIGTGKFLRKQIRTCVPAGCLIEEREFEDPTCNCSCSEWETRECLKGQQRRIVRECNPSGCSDEEAFLFDETCPVCSCSSWQNQECIGNQRKQARVCNPSGCDLEERLVDDPSCFVERCRCGNWQDQECINGQRRQTRSCVPPGCGIEEQLVDDPSCLVIRCHCGDWQNQECVNGQRKQTRVCVPPGCDIERQLVDDPSCLERVICRCGDWQDQDCLDGQRRQTRTCQPSGCEIEERLVNDLSCQKIVGPIIENFVKPAKKGVKEAIQPVAKIVKETVKPIMDKAVKPVAKVYKKKVLENKPVQKVNRNIVAPTVAVGATANLAATVPLASTAIPFFQYLLQIARLFFTEPIYFLSRKRKFWGTVYDALTKEPIALAVVGLYSKETNKLLATKVTGSDGRYYFLLKPFKKYYLRVKATNYNFPSRFLAQDSSDGIYDNIYHGEEITSKPEESATSQKENKVIDPPGTLILPRPFLNLNIPLDPWAGMVSSPSFKEKFKTKLVSRLFFLLTKRKKLENINEF